MNLLLRVITATLLMVFVAWLLFEDDGIFYWASIALSTAIAFEWSIVSGLSSSIQRWLFASVQLALLILAYQSSMVFLWLLHFLLPFVVALWCVLIAVVISYKAGRYRALLSNTGIKLVFGFFVITAFWVSLIRLHQENVWLLVLLLVVCISFDSFAYIVGRWKGKNKLCPDISPGKTWEGLIGGAVLALLVSVVVNALLVFLSVFPSSLFISYTLLACLAIIFSLFGDLVESLMKRIEGIKDSSHILPGHGGLLDRFDSYFAALPICAFFF